MAIAAAVIWNVQTGGNANNGGGFKSGASGTDYSKQNASQYSLTGVTSAGAGATVLTAAAAADMVGNIANVLSGTNFTAGRREIISVVVGVSITFDANVTTGIGAAGAIEVGGGVPLPTTIAGSVVAGNTVYIKSGTAYTQTAQASFAGSAGAEIRIEGYTTTHGDLGIATITSATNSVSLFQLVQASTYIVRALKFTHTAGTRGIGVVLNSTTATRVYVRQCEFDGCLIGVSDATGSGAIIFISHTEIHNCTSNGVFLDGITQLFIYACWIHNCTSHGINTNANNNKTIHVSHSIVTGNGGDGWNDNSTNQGVQFLIFRSVFAGNTGDGFEQTSTGQIQSPVIMSSIFYGNGGLGVKWNGTLAPAYPIMVKNAWGANNSGGIQYSASIPAGSGDVPLTADPFVNAAGGDYNLNDVAGGGAACKGVADPATIP